MDLRHLRYFIAITEHGSVRLAADHVHISQPAISRQIHDLEEELGAALFDRGPRGLSLTPIGEAFLVRARGILADVQAAKDQARRMATGLSGHLSVGFVENATWDGVVPQVFRAFKEHAPEVDLELRPLHSPEQLDQLEAGSLDGAFVYPFASLPAHCTSQRVALHDVVVALPNSWQFRGGKPRRLRDLADRSFITFPRHVYPDYYDNLLNACAALGGPLHSVQSVTTEAAILSLVSSGMGAAIVNSANQFRPPALVEFVSLDDLSIPMHLTFVTRQDNPNPALKLFSMTLRDQLTTSTA
ncbi:LysR family transcriptional regulator [Bordetella genomosp. 4]|uniref:LysR family transcriptional regulator n=1 Tax=Bordetella genomosp. 4 TaxID=463044 RepID=A0A261U3Q6_9BORD|nr:LysR family transcriptional regulator [Bordetella genomosp. 4]OZI56022.1 LysR family transcriptional regulator [Bordetella genomosp. 4]